MSKPYFTIAELTRSSTAEREGINNEPTAEQERAMHRLINNVLTPVREQWGRPILVSSGFRSVDLNRAIGGAKNSDHCRGFAADLVPQNRDADGLYRLMRDMLRRKEIEVKQLIRESANGGREWIHCSHTLDDNKGECFRMVNSRVVETFK